MDEIDRLRQELDDLVSETKEGYAFDHLCGIVADILNVLALSRAGAGAEVNAPFPTEKSVFSPPPPVSPRYKCDGAAECALSDNKLIQCPHFGPHTKNERCGIDAGTRCSNCPRPHGVCKEVKA